MIDTIDSIDHQAARDFHATAFVFDFAPLGEPIVMTDRHRSKMLAGIDAGDPAGTILQSMCRNRLEELRDNPATRGIVASVWRNSGVKAVQVTLGALSIDPSGWDGVIADLAHWQRRVRVAEDVAICLDADDLTAAHQAGKMGVLLGTQDTAMIERDLAKLNLFYDFGVRVMQLTYNTRNLIGDGCMEREQSGISRFGLEVVKRMNELGIVIDVSHSGVQTTFDAIEYSKRPVAITHSCCMSVASHPRAKTDDHLRALRDRDGFFGVVAVPFFVRPGGSAKLDDMLRHIDHAVGILGEGRVGIATDWGLWSPDTPPELMVASRRAFMKHGFSSSSLPELGECMSEFDDWQKWPNITAGLFTRGYSPKQVGGLIGGNWLDFLRRYAG